MIPPPFGTLQQWTDAVRLELLQYDNVPELTGDDWRLWATGFFNNPQVAVYHPPSPYDFSSWQDWGTALTLALAALPGANRVVI